MSKITFAHLVRRQNFPKTAMGIGGGIRQCCRKCHPMLILRRQKKFRRKGFHICGLSFQVLQFC